MPIYNKCHSWNCNCCCCLCYTRPPLPAPTSPPPTLFPVSTGDVSVSGEGRPGCTVIVTLPGGMLIATITGPDGLWTANVQAGTTLSAGETISAVQSCPAALPSRSVTTIVEAVPTWTVTGLVSPVVYDDLGLGDAFLNLFNIVVELRTSLHVPSSLRAVVERNGTDTGRFAITDVPQGNYILYIDRPGYLPRTLAVSVTAGSPIVIEVQPPDSLVFLLLPGDVNGDGIVNEADNTLLRTHLFKSYPNPQYLPNADLNADSHIDARDLSLLTSNFDRTSAQYPGAIWD